MDTKIVAMDTKIVAMDTKIVAMDTKIDAVASDLSVHHKETSAGFARVERRLGKY